MPTSHTVADLQERVKELENELKKAKKGMSNAAKKFKNQETLLNDAQQLCKEQSGA